MKTILLLEDDENIRDVIGLILNSADFHIVNSSCIKEFKQHLHQNVYDLFILDLMLPDGNGNELCFELKAEENTKEIPVLMMSANFNKYFKLDSSKADCLIGKPFDINVFVHQVQKLVN